MKQITIAIVAILATSLLFSSYPSGNAVTYVGHDGSVDDNITKAKAEKMKRGSNLWSYIIRACANDYTMGISSVILKSDIDQVHLGVNKNLAKGECTYFGAVMMAKDGKTLGAELIETHEALEKYQSIENSLGSLSGKQFDNAVKQLVYYRSLLGNLF